MAGVQRTPPKLHNISLTQTQSEPDINTASEICDNVTTRRRQPRQERSPGGQHEVQEDLLARWKKDQDTRISKMLEEQTAFMSKLVTDISEIKAQNKKIQESNAEICKTSAEIERSMSFMNQGFEELRKEVEELKKDRQEQRRYIESLEKKIIDLQYKSRASGIELRNIPLTNNENTTDLIKTVCNISKTVGVPILEAELRDVYRLPGKSASNGTDTSLRPIIAEFTTVRAKQNMLSAVRSFNNSSKSKEDKLNTELIGIPGKRQAIYVAEQLPPSSKKLFYLAREFAKKNGYVFCWTSNANIFLRKQTGDKQLLVSSEKCLLDLDSTNM